MRKGFRIEIERGLPAADKQAAQEFANKWAARVLENNGSWKNQTQGGWRSYLRRGVFGQFIDSNRAEYDDLVFRRISKRQRIFGIMRAKHMKTLDGQEVNLRQCMCPIHRGGVRVIVPVMPEMKTFVEYGEIKG